MNTRPISSVDRENLLTMLRTAKNRKTQELQELLPSIRQQVEQSVDMQFIEQFGLIPLAENVRTLREQIMGFEKPSDSVCEELSSAEREIRALGFDVKGSEKVILGSEWKKRERDVIVDLEICQRLKEERARHLGIFDDAISRVKAAKSLPQAREIVDSVIA